ncbi:MAG: NADH:ubiquinone reductase (Na(+)-transporting) subunit E [Candidatus Riflebacteria bacterium]|nr:NADH:ubiquinone reductase (Na(+)-transporting) subunit E [Candidatus Riflebacteria bacterium]
MIPDLDFKHLFYILFASGITNNIALNYFLGMCPFLSLSKNIPAAFGMGVAVTAVILPTAAVNWLINHFLLEPFQLEIFQFMVFILTIAGMVQLVEIVIDQFFPRLQEAFGLFLPLIAVNTAILGVSIFMLFRQYSFFETLFFALGSGIGWTIAIVTLAGIRNQLVFSNPEKNLGDIGITLLIAGFMAMAFAGFKGIASL